PPAPRPDPPVDRHPPIVPAMFTKLDAVAVLTARLLPAPLLLAPTITDLAVQPGRHRRDRPSNQDRGGRTAGESARALGALHRVREACPSQDHLASPATAALRGRLQGRAGGPWRRRPLYRPGRAL